jgi:hypothetical protein
VLRHRDSSTLLLGLFLLSSEDHPSQLAWLRKHGNSEFPSAQRAWQSHQTDWKGGSPVVKRWHSLTCQHILQFQLHFELLGSPRVVKLAL